MAFPQKLQNSELFPTATLNEGLRIHQWYMMPEAYSDALINNIFERFGVKSDDTVLDPFSGTGTTVVSAVQRGINAVGLEVNPFLSFVAQTKLVWSINITEFEQVADQFLKKLKPILINLSAYPHLFSDMVDVARKDVEAILAKATKPEMPRLEKWIAPRVIEKLITLRYLIETEIPKHLHAHFLLVFAATLRPVSNMKLTPHAFGSRKEKEDAPVYDTFAQLVYKMLDDLRYVQELDTQVGRAEIIQCDSRYAYKIKSDLLPASLGLTSPPYLNNLDYTMQTRMELFFLRLVNNMTDLRNLRKAMLICDAKAMYKDIKDSEKVIDFQSIQNIASQLRKAHEGKNWGWDYAFMTTQYCGGMLQVLTSVQQILKKDAAFILVVGESAHSGVKIPLPELIAELGEASGFKCEQINEIRQRRSSSHRFDLSESEVILRRI